MKRPLLLSALCAITVSLSATAADPGVANLQAIMQGKLQDSQNLLAAVATGNFQTMEKDAKHLVGLANLTSWYSNQTPREQVLIGNFRFQAEALLKAAETKNIDAASLAYTQLTLSCFECHKKLREPRVAGLPLPMRESYLSQIR